jgi:hypothetical protein
LVEEPDEAARVAARDARIKAYRERERARVVAAFDRFLERMFDEEWWDRQHRNPDYVAVEVLAPGGGRPGAGGGGGKGGSAYHPIGPCDDPGCCTTRGWRPVPDEHPCSGGRCPSPEAHAEGAHDL